MYGPYDLKQQLFDAPQEFEFGQAVSLLLSEAKKGAALDSSLDDMFIFSAAPLLSPSPSDIASIQRFWDGRRKKIKISARFAGISGLQGPLPDAYVEEILRLGKNRAGHLEAFLNIFNSTLLRLHFLMADKKLPTLGLSRPYRHTQGRCLISLSGYVKSERGVLSPQALLCSSRHFWQRPRSQQGLSQVISSYFGLPNKVFPFEGRWCSLGSEGRSPLGKGLRLGRMLMGERFWKQDYGVRLVLSFDSFRRFAEFLPSGELHKVLVQLVRAYVGASVPFRLGLRLKGMPQAFLGKKSSPLVLGYTSWLKPSADSCRKTTVLLKEFF